MEPIGVTEVTEKLHWTAPDFHRLGECVRSILLPFVGDAHSFRAHSAWGESPTTTKRYESLGSWEASLSSAPDDMSVDLHSNDAGRQVSLWLYNSGRRGSISVKAPDEDVEEAKRLVGEMSRSLRLTPSGAEPRRRVRLERVYQTSESNDREWLSSLITFLEAAADRSDGASCSYKISAPPEWEYSYSSVGKWKADVLENWDKVSRLHCDLHGPDESVRVNWDLTAGEFRADVSSPDEARAQALLHGVEQHAGLTALTHNPNRHRLQGEQNFYFTTIPASWEWLEGAVGELFKHVGDPNLSLREVQYSEFSASKIAEQPKPIIWQEKEPWLDFVRENWASLMLVRCYVSSRKLNFNFEFEPPHDWVALRIQAQTRSRVLEITQELQEKLGLQPIEGASYGPVRSSGYYSINNWSNQGFARAVEQAVAQFPKYSVKQAVVIEEKGEAERTHTAFGDISPFLARLEKGKRYIAAHLQIKGPQGAQMAIHLTDKRRKLELKSHLHPDKFPDLVKLFDEELELKRIAETKEEAAGQGRAWQNSLLVLVFIPLLTAVLTSTLLSQEFRNAAIPKHSLQVVNPRSNDNKPIVLETRQFDVYWLLQTEQWFTKKVDPKSPADYRLFGNGKLLKEGSDARPGEKFELLPGTYQLEITSTLTGEQTSITFTVSDPRSDGKSTP